MLCGCVPAMVSVTQQEEGLASFHFHHHSTGSCDAEGGSFAIYILNVPGQSCQTVRRL